MTGSGESPEAASSPGSASSPPAGSAGKPPRPTASPVGAFGSTLPQAAVLHNNKTFKQLGSHDRNQTDDWKPRSVLSEALLQFPTWGP